MPPIIESIYAGIRGFGQRIWGSVVVLGTIMGIAGVNVASNWVYVQSLLHKVSSFVDLKAIIIFCLTISLIVAISNIIYIRRQVKVAYGPNRRFVSTRETSDYNKRLRAKLLSAKYIQAFGISNDRLSTGMPIEDYINILNSTATRVEILFLDPQSQATDLREKDERRTKGMLATRILHSVQDLEVHIHAMINEHKLAVQGRIEYRFYDQYPIYNYIIIDNEIVFLSLYGTLSRGSSSPATILDKGDEAAITFFSREFNSMWKNAKRPVKASQKRGVKPSS